MLNSDDFYSAENSGINPPTTTDTNRVIRVFSHDMFGDIRVAVGENIDPVFCLADICSSIGVPNYRNVKKKLDSDDVYLVDIMDDLGGSQKVVFVSEFGMYHVIIRSDSYMSKPFRKWVARDILPVIRKA